MEVMPIEHFKYGYCAYCKKVQPIRWGHMGNAMKCSCLKCKKYRDSLYGGK